MTYFPEKKKRSFVGDGAKSMGKYESGTIRKCYFCKVETDELSVDIYRNLCQGWK